MALEAQATAALDAAFSDAAQVSVALQREALARAEFIALGRETIGDLPYFQDLGLSSDDTFLFALGRRGAAHNPLSNPGGRPFAAFCRLCPGDRSADAFAMRAAWRMRAASRPAWRLCCCPSAGRKRKRSSR